ncbi:MAG: phosphate acetyltransferase [Gammaproteobacteria bacterium]|nr:phosphate acetyltransferase [Gammaproteobacteria bacterium]
MSVIDGLLRRAQCQLRRVIFPDQDDPRLLAALEVLCRSRLLTPILLNPVANLPEGCEIFSKRRDAKLWYGRALEAWLQSNANRSDTAAARLALKCPLLFSAMLVRIGYADGGVAGSLATTAEVVRAGIRGIGLAQQGRLVSSSFIMEMPDKTVFSFGDCAVIPEPSSRQLADIAIDSAQTHQRLTGSTPRVALLSFSTNGSALHPAAGKVRAALPLIKQRQPELIVDGEIQFDAAINPTIAKTKMPQSVLAGRANVFIFPDLNAANIASKITEHLAGAHAIGPVLQGLAKPWIDLSRGCKSADIVSTAAVASVLATKGMCEIA